MKSPLSISYSDLIKHMEHQVNWMERSYPDMKLYGKISANAADRNLSCARTLLKLLVKHKKNPQLNLEDLFNEIKSNT